MLTEEEGSSARDSVTDVTDLTDVGKREEGRPSRREERGEKEEARKSFSCLSRYSLVIVNHNR